jgi:hypothetical protein
MAGFGNKGKRRGEHKVMGIVPRALLGATIAGSASAVVPACSSSSPGGSANDVKVDAPEFTVAFRPDAGPPDGPEFSVDAWQPDMPEFTVAFRPDASPPDQPEFTVAFRPDASLPDSKRG